MTDIISARHQFPYLAVAQAQKEITHNEALLMVDALLHPVVEAELNTTPTITVGTQKGLCWLIGTAPNGVWINKAAHIAYWTGEGWRYFAPVEGMHIRNKSLDADQIWSSGSWITPGVIANPVGGTVIDIECRAILTDLLSLLRSTGEIGH
jgi:Protein of unknown function (DUF2793)